MNAAVVRYIDIANTVPTFRQKNKTPYLQTLNALQTQGFHSKIYFLAFRWCLPYGYYSFDICKKIFTHVFFLDSAHFQHIAMSHRKLFCSFC